MQLTRFIDRLVAKHKSRTKETKVLTKGQLFLCQKKLRFATFQFLITIINVDLLIHIIIVLRNVVAAKKRPRDSAT